MSSVCGKVTHYCMTKLKSVNNKQISNTSKSTVYFVGCLEFTEYTWYVQPKTTPPHCSVGSIILALIVSLYYTCVSCTSCNQPKVVPQLEIQALRDTQWQCG